jgi:hypothetical protein|nr:MAG TPA: Major head protein [Bacteriophage sp.]
MKIDTSKIEGYAEMTPEQKLAALEGFEYEDHAAELEKQKAAVSKANSDAAEWKRKHNALLTDEQRKQQEQADKLESMEKELAGLRKEKTVSEYKAKLVAQGYDEALANETAAAMESGDMTTVFTNNQKFLTDYAKRVVAEKLKGTPRGADGGTGGVGMDYSKKITEAQGSGDYAAAAYYTRLQAEAEASNNK